MAVQSQRDVSARPPFSEPRQGVHCALYEGLPSSAARRARLAGTLEGTREAFASAFSAVSPARLTCTAKGILP